MNSGGTCFVSSYQHRSRDLSIPAGCPEGFFQRGHYEQWKKQDQSSTRPTTQHYEHEFSLVLILYSYSNLWASIFDPLALLPISSLESAEVFGVVSRDSHIILCRQIRLRCGSIPQLVYIVYQVMNWQEERTKIGSSPTRGPL